MKHLGLIAALAACVLMAGCGKSSGNKAAEQYLSGMNRIATAVEKVDDEASAKKAAETISEVAGDMDEVSEQLEGMSEAEKRATEEKYAEEFAAAQQRIMSAMQGLITRPDLLRIISEEMENLPDMR